MRQLERSPAALTTTADARAGAARVVAADGEAAVDRGLALWPTGEYLDHATDGVGTVEAGIWSAHHFDAFDLIDRNVLERGLAGGGGSHAHAVDQHQRLVGFGATQEQRAFLAETTVIADRHAGDAVQQFRQRVWLESINVLTVDDGDRGQRLLQRLLATTGGDHHRIELCIATPLRERRDREQ